MDLRAVLDLYRRDEAAGATVERGLRLRSRVAPPASDAELLRAWDRRVPADVIELWQVAREAWLFEDVDSGLWGLHLLSPDDSAAQTARHERERPRDVREGDVVIGEFLGDSELLVFAPSEADRVLVALPLDPRDEWYRVAPTPARFLRSFHAADGEKFWER